MYLTKTSGNLNPRGQQPQSNLQTTTIRSFEGGLNVTDTDLNMSPKYAKVLDNLERAIDGSLALRPGTVLLSNQLVDPTDIVNCYYFNGVVVTVQTSGNMYKVAGNGSVLPLLALGVQPWVPTGLQVNFTIFNSDLIIVDGVNKPIIVSGKRTLPNGSPDPNYMLGQYLVDLGSLSSVNTPVGNLIAAHGQYTCIAGVASDPSILFISNRGTSGTYFGDGDPNDAVNIDLGPRVSLGSARITGLVAYRDKLMVTFERGVLLLNLGVYVGDTKKVHAPTDDGFIEEFGCLTHRSLVSVGDDTFYCDNVGVNSVTRTTLFNTLRPTRISHLIDPLITAAIQPLSVDQIAQYVFAVYDLRHFRYMLFVPSFGPDGKVAETICFSYSNIPALKVEAWARLRGWKWQAACRTGLQNVVFARGNKLYAYDFDNQTTTADRLNDPDVEQGIGEPVAFEWELPWADFKKRMDIKQTRYIALDTQGKAGFTVNAYVDNYHIVNGVDSPMLSMTFYAGSGAGYGNSPYGNTPYGGIGRASSDERLYAWTTKFKLLKLRIFGSTRNKLKFISVSLAYVAGGIRR